MEKRYFDEKALSRWNKQKQVSGWPAGVSKSNNTTLWSNIVLARISAGLKFQVESESKSECESESESESEPESECESECESES